MAILNAKDVLVVDDDEGIRGLVTVALRRLGLTCETAVDGVDGLDRIGQTSYVVVLVDLMMPRLDGAGFVTALREQETATHRPVVVMMTAFTVRDLPDLGSKVQVVLQKPFDVFALAELVRDCVDSRHACEDGIALDINRIDGPATSLRS